MKNRRAFVSDGVPRPQPGQYLVEDLTLPRHLAAEIGDPAHSQHAAGNGEAFHQQHARTGTGRRSRRSHPRDATPDNGHIRHPTNRYLPCPDEFLRR
ncbi:MAG: hypothetical protein BWY09_02811 [Candidatus Hydrogenedentes bacterium ADurb.Bin179]|nr:MAG: hypothetical protein BWY09_02811 [Candidatus Hydrogenedentes bacterium ADurb.Bin179]